MKRKMAIGLFVAFSGLINTAYCNECTTYDRTFADLSNDAKYYTIYTDHRTDPYTYNGTTYATAGYGATVFPISLQGTKTKFRIRPRKDNCTYGKDGTVKNEDGEVVKLSNDPGCNDEAKGDVSYTVPTYTQVNDAGGNWARGYGVFGTKKGGDPYETYVLYGIYPDDGLGTTVYIKQICFT